MTLKKTRGTPEANRNKDAVHLDEATRARLALTSLAHTLEESIQGNVRMPPKQKERILALTANESGAAALYVAFTLESEGGEYAPVAKAYIEGYMKGTFTSEIFVTYTQAMNKARLDGKSLAQYLDESTIRYPSG